MGFDFYHNSTYIVFLFPLGHEGADSAEFLALRSSLYRSFGKRWVALKCFPPSESVWQILAEKKKIKKKILPENRFVCWKEGRQCCVQFPPVSPAVAWHFLLMHLSVTDSRKTPPNPPLNPPWSIWSWLFLLLLICSFYLVFLLVFFTKNLHHLRPRGLHLLSGPRCSPSLHALSPLISPLPLSLSFLPTALSFISCTFPQTRSREPLRCIGFPPSPSSCHLFRSQFFFFLCASLLSFIYTCR